MKWLLWAAIFSSVGPVLLHVLWFPWGLSDKTESWGHFGDFFGGVVGTLFVIIGSVFVYRTYSLQKAQAYQTSFENTFFRLIEFHHHLVDSLQTPDVISFWYEPSNQTSVRPTESADRQRGIAELVRLKRICDNEIGAYLRPFLSGVNTTGARLHFVHRFSRIYSSHLFHIGHYFRHLYWIFKFIRSSNLSDDEKRLYASLVRAQLSPEEVILIGLHGMTTVGNEFKPLIEEYRILHPRHPDSPYYKLFEAVYDPSAIADQSHSEVDRI